MRYRTILADPPWHYDGFAQAGPGGVIETRELPYPSMTLRAIKDLRVYGRHVRYVGEDDSRLFMWTTNRYLPDAFAVMKCWNYEYRQLLVWHKTNPNPNGGSVAPISAEYLLVGVRGSPLRKARLDSSVVSTPIERVHSKKPEVFLDLIEICSPGPYLELFSRRSRFGWAVWGNEALTEEDDDEVQSVRPFIAPAQERDVRDREVLLQDIGDHAGAGASGRLFE